MWIDRAPGRYSTANATAIHGVGRALNAELQAGERLWDDRWAAWMPPPELLIPPALRDGWEEVPAERIDGILTGARMVE